MKKWFGIVLVTGSLLMSVLGCSTVGPLVTNISADGKGGLIIEKCVIKMDSFSGIMSTEGCTEHTIQILSEKK